MKNRHDVVGTLEMAIGLLIYLIPIVCGFYIITWAGRAYHEGHKLFVEESLDRPGEAHSEMVIITEEEAGSALTVGRMLERQKLISSGVTFAVKAKLSGYSGRILPGSFILSSDMNMEQMLETLSRVPGAEKEKKKGSQEEGSGETSRDRSSGSEKENKDVWGQF